MTAGSGALTSAPYFRKRNYVCSLGSCGNRTNAHGWIIHCFFFPEKLVLGSQSCPKMKRTALETGYSQSLSVQAGWDVGEDLGQGMCALGGCWTGAFVRPLITVRFTGVIHDGCKRTYKLLAKLSWTPGSTCTVITLVKRWDLWIRSETSARFLSQEVTSLLSIRSATQEGLPVTSETWERLLTC